MSHVRSILGLFERLQSVDISVHQDRCVLVRNRNASCMKCAEACTSACITCQDGEIAISPERCVGCGTCATVCPTCALEANHFQTIGSCTRRAFRLRKTPTGRWPSFASRCCRRPPDATIRQGGWRDMPRAHGGKRADLARARRSASRDAGEGGLRTGAGIIPDRKRRRLWSITANALLAAWGRDGIARVADKLPAGTRRRDDAAYDADRRGFLADMIGAAKTVAQTTADCVVEEALGDVEIVRGGIEEGRGHREASTFQKVQEDGTLPPISCPIGVPACCKGLRRSALPTTSW